METENYNNILAVKAICDQFANANPDKFPNTRPWITAVVAALVELEEYRDELEEAKEELKAHRSLRSRMLAMRFLDVSPHGPYGMPLDNIINKYKNVVNGASGKADNVLAAIKATRTILGAVRDELDRLVSQDVQLTGGQKQVISKLAQDIRRHLIKTEPQPSSALESLTTDPTSSSYWPSSVIASSSSVGWP
jgi:hypothetical protein